MNETQVKNFETGKAVALWLGGAVYAGVVLLFLAFYQNLMAAQFTGLLQVIARIGAVLVALNALALPVALHYWTVTKGHKFAAVVFYAGDIVIMGLNVLAAANHAGGNIPEWLQTYTSYAPASIVFVLAGWAILFMVDPGQRALVSMSETMTEAKVSIVKRATEYIQSDEGIDAIIAPFAAKLAAKIFNERSLLGTARPLQVQPENDDELVKAVAAKMAEGMTALNVPPVTLEAGQASAPFPKNGRSH